MSGAVNATQKLGTAKAAVILHQRAAASSADASTTWKSAGFSVASREAAAAMAKATAAASALSAQYF